METASLFIDGEGPPCGMVTKADKVSQMSSDTSSFSIFDSFELSLEVCSEYPTFLSSNCSMYSKFFQ
jgi:hypothetical protein